MTAELEDRIEALEDELNAAHDQIAALEEERDDLKRDNGYLTEKVEDATAEATEMLRGLTK